MTLDSVLGIGYYHSIIINYLQILIILHCFAFKSVKGNDTLSFCVDGWIAVGVYAELS